MKGINMLKKHLVVPGVVTVFVAAFAVPVFAIQNGAGNGSSNGNSSTGNSSAGSGANSNGQGLSSARKKVCENRQAAINKTMSQYSQTLQNRLQLFNKISLRIQAYYADHQLNSAQYVQLMAQVTTRQQEATQAMNQMRQGASIDCSSSDPIGHAQQFKTRVQITQTAMKQYRIAIKNLLSAVIDAAKTGGGE